MMNEIMTATHEEIVRGIQNHIDKYDSKATDWYIGIAINIRNKLFEAHKVSEENGVWIYRAAENHRVAKEIKKHFVSLGLKNNDEDDDQSGTVIFVYKSSAT